MPQMSPMSWLMIYMYFIILIMMFIMKIYFTKTMNIKSKMTMTNMKNEINWKW